MSKDSSRHPDSPVELVEFPADDPERAKGFWSHVLGVSLEPRLEAEGHGWQTHGEGPALGLHERGPARATVSRWPILPSPTCRRRSTEFVRRAAR